jgi:hypothetical protein
MLFAFLSCWAESIENSVDSAQQAREGLIAGGDLANAGYVHYVSVSGMLDCALSLERYLTEVEAALAFVRRTGNEHLGQVLDPYRWLAGVLLGERRPRPVRPSPSTDTPVTGAHNFSLISIRRTLPLSSAIRPAWSGTPQP